MFVAVARVTLQIPESGSLKAKRQVLRRVSDRVKARFNVSVAEVDDQDLWQKATLAMAVVGNDRRHVNEMMDKILQYVEDMYVAPVIDRELEILSLGERLYGGAPRPPSLEIPKGERSLAEAEGLGAWEDRHQQGPSGPGKTVGPPAVGPRRGGRRGISLDEARQKARSLRNKREWEDK